MAGGEKLIHYFLAGVFALVALAIIFVRAGAHGGKSGAEQAATILQVAGQQVTAVTKSIASIGS